MIIILEIKNSRSNIPTQKYEEEITKNIEEGNKKNNLNSERVKNVKNLEKNEISRNETITDVETNENQNINSNPQKNKKRHCVRIFYEIKKMFQLIKKKKLSLLLVSNTSFKLAPNFRSSFDYFLLHIMQFTNKEFAIQKILDSLFFFLGILLLNTVFQKFNKKKFLRFNGVTYAVLICILVGVVELVFKFPKHDFFILILVYSSLHSLFLEMLFIPIYGIFLDICPAGKESLFMSIVFTIDSVFFQFGRLLGFGCVHLLQIHTDSYVRLPYLIAITGVSTMAAAFLLWISYVPLTNISKRRKLRQRMGLRRKDLMVFRR